MKKRKQIKDRPHKYKVGDIVGIKVYGLIFYGRVKKKVRIGANNQPAYVITGFGDPVHEDKYMFKSRKKTL